MKESDRSLVVGIISFAIVVLLALWWFSAASPDSGVNATSTPTTSSSATNPVVSVPKSTGTAAKKSDVVAVALDLALGSRFASLLKSSGVESELSGAGPYTIFVPTDGAFARLPAGTISKMSAAQLKRLIENHIIVGRAIDADANIAGVVTSLSKDALNFTVNADKSVSVGSAKILETYKGTNGIVYTINGVLLPPQSNSFF